MKNVRAILPANPGWQAGFSAKNSQGYRFEPVAAWAQVELPSGELSMVAIIRAGVGAEDMNLVSQEPEFLGIIPPGELLEVWMCNQNAERKGTEYAAPGMMKLIAGPSGRGGPGPSTSYDYRKRLGQ